ncbi:MAG: cytochrome C oxidase subunit IV family protein [Planctomycetota bacterium]
MSHDAAPIDTTNQWTEGESHGDHDHHVVPMWLLVGVLLLLLFLTWVTVAVTWVDLDAMFHVANLNVTVALGVAVVKAFFVGYYFMHLRWDAPFNGLILIASLVFVVLFVSWAILDTRAYDYEVDTPRTVRAVQTQ